MYDVHTHFIPTEVMDWLDENKRRVNAEKEKRDADKSVFLNINGKWAFELKELFIDEQLYIEKQKESGVVQSLVSPIPQLFLYEFEKETTLELSKVYNDSLCRMSKSFPSIAGLAALPLNAPGLAADELSRAMSNGLKGAIIGPGCGNLLLTDAAFTPLWEEANRLGAVIFIHPLLSEDPRLRQRMMPNLIGVPWETTLCATDILLSGMMDKYPRVKILLAHGGGLLPYQVGRLDKGYSQWKQVKSALQAPPSEYLKRFWYDSVLWNSEALQYLLKLVGEEKVLPGSDFPFDLCAWPPLLAENEAAYLSFVGDSRS